MDFSNRRNIWLNCNGAFTFRWEVNRSDHATHCKSSRVLLWIYHSEHLLANSIFIPCKGSNPISADDDPGLSRQSERTHCVIMVVLSKPDIFSVDHNHHNGWRFRNPILDLLLVIESGVQIEPNDFLILILDMALTNHRVCGVIWSTRNITNVDKSYPKYRVAFLKIIQIVHDPLSMIYTETTFFLACFPEDICIESVICTTPDRALLNE